jgi:hypothetical protein
MKRFKLDDGPSFACMVESDTGPYMLVADFDALLRAPTSPASSESRDIPSTLRDLLRWRLCASYNDSYFGEPAGLVKRAIADTERWLSQQPASSAIGGGEGLTEAQREAIGKSIELLMHEARSYPGASEDMGKRAATLRSLLSPPPYEGSEAGRWVAVTERLPPCEGIYEVSTKYRLNGSFVNVAQWRRVLNEWPIWIYCAQEVEQFVEAWRELPPPYQPDVAGGSP